MNISQRVAKLLANETAAKKSTEKPDSYYESDSKERMQGKGKSSSKYLTDFKSIHLNADFKKFVNLAKKHVNSAATFVGVRADIDRIRFSPTETMDNVTLHFDFKFMSLNFTTLRDLDGIDKLASALVKGYKCPNVTIGPYGDLMSLGFYLSSTDDVSE